ncbi:hypothetical protein QUF76_14695 [Desulfobacterales bacterium HSG16]|nr:hypothetical protein [Desulfobacterales bacterium HSG16]
MGKNWMGKEKYREIRPGRKPFKALYIKIALFALGRAMQSASNLDKNIKKEVETWPEGFTAMFKVLPRGPYISWMKEKGNTLVYKGESITEDEADLVIYFKNMENAFLVFSAQAGTAQAFAEHRMSLKGDLAQAMSLTRCLNIVQTYLYPDIIAKMVFKRVPHIPLPKKLFYRLIIIVLGIPLGM